MNKIIDSLIIAAIVLLVAYIGGTAVIKQLPANTFGSVSGAHTERACTITHTTVAIGHQLATTVLSANSQRAWAVVEQTRGATGIATTSPFLSLGGTATANNGFELSTSTPTLTFGKKTDLPFTGAVTAITNTSSTSVLVSECVY